MTSTESLEFEPFLTPHRKHVGIFVAVQSQYFINPMDEHSQYSTKF